MMFDLRIQADNDAFAEDETREVCRILRELAARMEREPGEGLYRIKDINGNDVGSAEFL